MIAIDEAFVAGPAIRNTNAAPGDIPFAISATAIGIDAVAHTYNGIEIPKINKNCIKVFVEK